MSEEEIKYYAKEFMYTDTKEIQILQPYIMIEIINLLQQENKELKEEIKKKNKQINDNEKYYKDKIKKSEDNWKKLEEFVINKIKELEEDNVDDEELKGYLIQKIDDFKYILSKMQEIRGD